MLALSGRLEDLAGFSDGDTRELVRVTTRREMPGVLARNCAFLGDGGAMPGGFGTYLALPQHRHSLDEVKGKARTAVLPASAGFLGDGDILRLSGDHRSYRVLFRAQSDHNSLLLTERCDHYCLMCSQPPKNIDDDWVMEDVERLIPMIPASTRSLGLTGGEPTLHGDRLLRLLARIKHLLPRTALHMLSNGRRFSDLSFAQAYAGVQHPDLMVGIPLYSDDPARHNYVVQAGNAFGETVRGILNLKRLHQRVELRVVLHRQTIDRLPQLAEYIARNLLFVDQVALMGLEITGFTRANLDKLWIDPYDYRAQLEAAVDILATYRVPARVYNHQLCVVPEGVRPFCVQSISDWKNEYLPACASCSLRTRCGGFFSSAVTYRHSEHIQPVLAA